MRDIIGAGDYLIPSLILQIVFSIGLGLIGLIGFVWAIMHGEFDNLEEAKFQPLIEEEEAEKYVNV